MSLDRTFYISAWQEKNIESEMFVKWKEKLVDYEHDQQQIIDTEYKDKRKDLISQQKLDISFHKSNKVGLSNALRMSFSRWVKSRKVDKIMSQHYKRKDRAVYLYKRPDDKLSSITLFPTPPSKLKINSNGKIFVK